MKEAHSDQERIILSSYTAHMNICPEQCLLISKHQDKYEDSERTINPHSHDLIHSTDKFQLSGYHGTLQVPDNRIFRIVGHFFLRTYV